MNYTLSDRTPIRAGYLPFLILLRKLQPAITVSVIKCC